jgi:hypothetical protein
MLVSIALAALLAAGPICKGLCEPDPVCAAVCGTTDKTEALKACVAARAEDRKTLDVTDAALMVAAGLADRVVACEAKLAKCEAKPACKKPSTKIVKKSKKPSSKPVEIVKQEQKQEQTQQQQVVVNITMGEPRLVKVEKKEESKPFPLGIGVRGAVGFTCNPIVFGLVGVRGRLLPAHLGLEVNTQFAYGHSAQLMVYPIQGPIAWHLDFGGLMYLNNGPKFNLLAGTGVEVQVVPHFSITADWRMTIAKPFYLGDSLLKSQLMLGVMLHTW